MAYTLTCTSPIDGSTYVERPLATGVEIRTALERARAAFAAWQATPLAERRAVVSDAVDRFVGKSEAIAEEITRQMGRPIAHAPFEVRGFEERARHMIAIAEEALADLGLPPKPGFVRTIRRRPWGVVLAIAPWNYPYLTSVNAVIPALMAGNVVILKASAQTPLVAERYAEAFAAAGLPDGVFQYLHLGHDATQGIIAENGGADYVAFTGSVAGGQAVQRAASQRFIGIGLELGGKDPAYVRADADVDHAIENLEDGVNFNAGQSCCGIERIYVHADVYDRFVDGLVAAARSRRLGNPLDPETTLGPMVRSAAADFVRSQIDSARLAGARALIDPQEFRADARQTPYLAPQVMIDVDHRMDVMREESFGPVVGVMKVTSDDEAVRLMNDSAFGLTAAIWTRDAEAAAEIGARIDTGTVFMNRCDYLDPALAWTGVKHSGRGCTLSTIGYEQLTKPMSFHFRTET